MTPVGPTGKVAVGFFSFTEVTDPAEHRAYNEWHMLDHLPEQIPLPGVVHGQRWVSAPPEKAARRVDEEPLAPVHYLTCYLMSEPAADTLRGFYDLGAHLRAAGRFHRHRRAHLSGPWRALRAVAAPRVRVSPGAVPYRPHRGVHVSVDEGGEGEALDAHLAWTDVTRLPALLEVPGVAGVWTFTTTPDLARYHRDETPRRITLCFVDGDLLETSAAIDEAEATAAADAPDAGVRTVLAGPFRTITPWGWDWFDAGA